MLSELSDKGVKQKAKRLGRGPGSGTGKTAGRGVKGQKARSGVAIKGFEGGQTPIYQRLPKRGFVNKFRTTTQVINIIDITKAIEAKKLGNKIDKTMLFESGLISKVNLPVKLLSNGDIKEKIEIEVDTASASAEEKITKAGGKVVINK